MAAIQLAKQAGATVLSTASSDEKLERLKEFGLDHGINYARENFVERTRELTEGRGCDVLDSIGGQTWSTASPRSPTGARSSASGWPAAPAPRSRRGSCGRRTTRYAACSSAGRCSTSTPAFTR